MAEIIIEKSKVPPDLIEYFEPISLDRCSVWRIPTHSYSGAHFATFPEELIIPMIKAGTSEKGVCPDCGRAWIRIIEKEKADITNPRPFSKPGNEKDRNDVGRIYEETISKTLGWQPTCKCSKEPVPAIVMDPFSGAGTSCMVAKKLWRNYLGIELNPEYVKLAQDRIVNECGTLF